jgi:hypothetical protein
VIGEVRKKVIQYFSQKIVHMEVEEEISSRFNVSVKKLYASRLKANIHESKYFASKVVYMMVEDERYSKFDKSICRLFTSYLKSE